MESNWHREALNDDVRFIRTKMNKVNILLTRACNFVAGRVELKASALLIPRTMAINEKYIQRMKMFERSITGERPKVKEIAQKAIFKPGNKTRKLSSRKRKKSSDTDNASDQFDIDMENIPCSTRSPSQSSPFES